MKREDPYILNVYRRYVLNIFTTRFYTTFSENHYNFLFKAMVASERKEFNKYLKKLVKQQKPLNTGAMEHQEIVRSRLREKGCSTDIDYMLELLNTANRNQDDWNEGIKNAVVAFPLIRSKLIKFVRAMFEENKIEVSKSSFSEKINDIKNIFKLDSSEIMLLEYFYFFNTNEDFAVFMGGNSYTSASRSDFEKIAKLCGCTRFDIIRMLSKDGRLKKMELIDRDYASDYSISSFLSDYLQGLTRSDLLSNFFKMVEISNAVDLADHNVRQDHCDVLKKIIENKKGVNVLLYGRPGAGKTEFAKSLAKDLKRSAYFIKQRDERNLGDRTSRKTSIYAAVNMLSQDNDLIVVDECDDILNVYRGYSFFRSDDDDTKAWLNELIEDSNQNIIWIANDIKGIDESTKRRFDYTLEFFELGLEQRDRVWQTQIKKTNASSYIDVQTRKRLVREFKLNAGAIAMALENVASVKGLRKSGDKVEVLEKILKQHQSFMYGVTKNKTQGEFDLDFLNTDIKPEKLIMSANRFLRHLDDNDRDVVNLSYLFQGPPGTGKTELARHIAEVLGRELLVKRLSDIRSMWYGESLKNIARMFREAESTNKILFLDEADTMIVSREGARDLHAAETNELLTQMENYRGILICATNFINAMDNAVMRRFAFKVKFDYLKPEVKARLFKRYFQKTLSDEQSSRLKNIQPLSPGDFKVVKQKTVFGDSSSTKEIVDMLELESSYKKERRSLGLISQPVR